MVTQDHYFTADPKVASRPRTIQSRPPGPELRARHRPRRLRARSPRLRAPISCCGPSAPIPPGELVDVGCGYGAIAITLALRNPDARVWAVDVNRRALDLCARNAERAGAGNVVPAEPDAVPDRLQFAAVYSNPPVRLGKAGAPRPAPHLDRPPRARGRGDAGGPAPSRRRLARRVAGRSRAPRRAGPIQGRLPDPRGACCRRKSA